MASDVLSRSQVVGWFPQTTHATAGTATGTYEEMHLNANFTIDQDADYTQNDTTSQSSLIMENARGLTDTTSGLPKLDFSMPADLRNIAPLFYLALGETTEVISSPYQKVIRPYWEDINSVAGKTTVVPDHSSANTTAIPPIWTLAGYRHAKALDGWVLQNALLNNMSFSIDVNARGVARLAQVNGQFVGKKFLLNQDVSAATFNSITSTWINNASDAFTLTIAGLYESPTEVCFKRYSLNINNNITSDCRTTGGNPANFKFSPEITCEVVIPYNSATYSALASALGGTRATFTLSSGSSGSTGYVNIKTIGRIVGNPHPADSSNYLDMTLTLRVEKADSYSTIADSCMTVTIADAVDRNYPAPA